MKHHYKDIRDRIGNEPKWFDEHGVPRYCDFSYRETADIYCSQAALIRIVCQNCGYAFDVAMTSRDYDRVSISDAIKDHSLHYGDPPNIECCDAGPTMNSEPKRILQFWQEDKDEWKRITSLEVELF